MLIITGSGRSGTGTMAKLLGGYHEFRSYYLMEKYFPDAGSHCDPFAAVEKRVMAMLDLHQGVDRETFVDSSNLYIYFIDALYLLNPDIKFILTLRNGKDFVRSAVSRRWHEHNTFGTAPLHNDPYFEKWDLLTPLQKNAWIWDYRNRKALDALRVVPEKQKLVIKIEDVNRQGTLDMLEAFTGKRVSDRDVASRHHNANSFFSLPPKEEWTERQMAEFNAIAGEMMFFLGYD